MSTEEEIKQIADGIYRSGTAWLAQAKEVNDATPFVYQAVQASQQFSNCFQVAPPNTGIAEIGQIRTALQQTQSLFASDPLTLHGGILSTAISGAATISAAGIQVTNMMTAASKSADPTIQCWATKNLLAFEQLQTSNENTAFISRKLATLYAGSDLEFQQALDEYFKAVAGTAVPVSAAIAMRNVLESLNGNFLQLARKYSQGAIRNWTDAALVVARGAPASVQTNQLISQKVVYDDLHGKKLTPTAKNDWKPSKIEWDSVYTQFIGFLFTVLGLIDFKDGS